MEAAATRIHDVYRRKNKNLNIEIKAKKTNKKQVSVQLPTSADNVELPAFVAVRRAAIDRYLLAAGPTAANPQQRRAAARWDRATDGRPTDA